MCKKFCLPILLFALFSATSIFAIGEDTSTLAGRLAIVGQDFNIYSYTLSDQTSAQLTNDADRSRRYQWPTWSTDGRLAYFCCDTRVSRTFEMETYVSRDGSSPGDVVYQSSGNTVIYAYWSPANCTDGPNCRDLALLVNDVIAGGLSVEMIRNRDGETTSSRVGEGAPFYYHWNAEGSRMVTHRDGVTIDIYDSSMGDVTNTVETSASAAFQAPVWSPIDERLLYGVLNDDETTTDLVIDDGNEQRLLVEGLNGLVSFLWSPDGRYIAYRILDQRVISPVIVLDAETGAVVAQTAASGIWAFFWSPDSRKIAYITIGDPRAQSVQANTTRVQNDLERRMPIQDGNALSWSVFEVESQREITLVSFDPTYEQQYVLQYFDQFAPSHRIWSPDSTHIVYSELVRVDDAVQANINVVDASGITTTPITVANGVLGVWSFDE